MTSRRDVLRLLTTGIAGTTGCLGGPASGTPSLSPAPVPTDTATPGPAGDPTTEPADSPTPSDDGLANWGFAWERHPDYEHVLGLDVADGTLYATLGDDGGPSAVAAVDPAAPAIDWTAEFAGRAVAGTDAGHRPIARDGWGVTVADDAVYAVTGSGDGEVLTAIDRSTGEPRWSVQRPRRLAVHGVVDGLVVATGREFFEPEHVHDTPEEPLTSVGYGIGVHGGDVQWTATFQGVADVAVGPGGVYVAAGDRLVGLDLDGGERFEYEGDAHPGRGVRAAGGRIYYLTAPDNDHSAIHGLDPNGDRVWRSSLPIDEVLLDGDRLYAGGSSVLALDPDGTVAWRDDRSYGQWLLLSPDGETLYTRSGPSQDRAAAYRTTDGTRLWTYRPPDLESPNAWPVAATVDTAVVEGITAADASDPFTTLYAVDRHQGTGTKSVATEPVFDVEAVGDTVVVAGTSVLALEP